MLIIYYNVSKRKIYHFFIKILLQSHYLKKARFIYCKGGKGGIQMQIKKVLTVGGDERMLYTSQCLANSGFDVEVYAASPSNGFDLAVTGDKSIASAAARADGIILPLPVSRDGVHLNACSLTLSELSDALERGQTVFAGMMDSKLKSGFFKKGIRVFDYFEREELAVNNAVPTAQGVIKIAMDNMKITLHASRCAVTGYGRTASVLADMLSALGADVTVAARKCSDLARARTRGLSAVRITELARCASVFDLLVNTVPSLVLDCSVLSALKKDCLVIDIASAPYGTDLACAKELGLNVKVPGSLPGKTAPKTAGEIIADAILNIIKEGS